tara:strand:+ start:2188 stop:2475 length:288 start_codon:yes stop_codon:yes gene_type:complete
MIIKNTKPKLHSNTLTSYTEVLPRISKRETIIHQFLLETSGTYTDREIMTELGFIETNQVRPRITSLVQRKLIREVGTKKCETTGRKVRLVSAVI